MEHKHHENRAQDTSTPESTSEAKTDFIQNHPEGHTESIDHAQPEVAKSNDTKKYFMYVLVGGLVLSALIAVVAVLVGEFSEVTWRALGTTASIVLHSFLALAFFSLSSGKVQQKFNELYINSILAIIVASFMTSVFSLWEILTGPIVGDLYATYFYTFVFSTLIRAILRASRSDKVTRVLADTSVGFSVVLYLMLLPPLFTDYPDTLPDFYYRLMGATAIVLGTTSVLTAIFNRLFVNKHPELSAKAQKHHIPTFVIVIAVILGIWLVPSLFFTILASSNSIP